MLRRLTAIASLIALMSITSVPPANAVGGSAVCAVGITFSISPPYVGADLTAGAPFSFQGSGTCVSTLAGDVVTTTTINGMGEAAVWNCALTIAGGNWSQRFSNFLPNVDGVFNLTGTNGVWSVATVDMPWVGTGELTTADVVKVGTCPLVDIGTITMTGVMELAGP